MRQDGYEIMLSYKAFRTKEVLKGILKAGGIEFTQYESMASLKEKIIDRISPPSALQFLTSPELHDWLDDIDLSVGGTKDHRIVRLIEYYDAMQIRYSEDVEDERKIWFDVFESLAFRDRQHLRAEGVIDKDLEIETKFEQATNYLFEKFLNHTPLKQPGTNKSDGLLSFKDMYIMWDNKSKETPGEVNLKSHIKQFHGYMEESNKPVPIFLVIAPGFTKSSEALAVRYAAENIGRNIVLITAGELKALAEEWSGEANKGRDDPFPLGMLARAGRFNREALGGLF